jgi:light-regulated signal transduction histidine kinase (bacteriophytochrome)
VVVDEPVSVAFAGRDRLLRGLLTAFALTFVLLAAVLWLGSQLAGERRKGERDRQMKAELEHLVAERTAALEATNKELESFSYSVSHDLRSPLRAITGFTRMLEEDSAEKLDDEGRRMLGVIRDNGVRMGDLIDDLLAFSRLGRKPLVCAETDMRAVVDAAIAEVRHDRAYAAREVIVEALPAAWCDPRLIHQVWTNLICNALKFTARTENPRVVISGTQDEASVTYSVKDNGAGFDMRFYDKLFGVFQRLHSDDDFAGTGVGLAIVQRVVTRHGGRVWAEGRPGEGAVFHFTLMRAAPAPADDEVREARPPS